MKILYISNERRAAALAARALHRTAPNVTVTWAQTLGSALDWVVSHPDLEAVVVEAEVQGQTCAPFVERVRSVGATTPIVVVTPAHLDAAVSALKAPADGYVVEGQSLEADLPRILGAAVGRERARRDIFERQLAELQGTRDRVEERLAAAEQARRATEQQFAAELEAAAARLADVQARHSAALAREARICTELQQRMMELEGAVRAAEERRASEAVAFADQLARRHAEFTASLTDAAHSRDTLAKKLGLATAALDEVQHARSAEADAAAEHLARREAELGAALAEAIAARSALESALTDAKAARQQLQQRAAADLAAAAERQAALEDLLAQETDARAALEQKLAAAEAARQDADHRQATELATAAMRVADVQARCDAALMELTTARAAFEQRLIEAAAALDRLRQERAADAAAAAEHLARREAEMGDALAEATAARRVLEQSLNEAAAAHERAEQRAAAALAAAAERQASLDGRLAREAEARASVEQQLAAANAARQESDQRHATELSAAGARFNDLQARHDTQLAESAAARAAFEQRLAEAAAALDRACRQRELDAAAAAEHLARREADMGVALADAAAANAGLERAFSDARASHEDARDRLGTALAAAMDREAQLLERLAGDAATRAALEQELKDNHAESQRARQRFLHVVSGYRRRTREHLASLDAQLAGERATAQRALAAQEDEIRRIEGERDRLQQALGTSREQLEHLHASLEEERQAHERARLSSESEIQRITAEYDQLRQSFDHLQTSFHTLEQIAGDHAVERARLERVVAYRDSELSAQASRHLAEQQAAQDATARVQEKLRQALEAGSSEAARLQREIDTVRHELGATRSRAEALRLDADRVPGLQAQLDASQKERRRQFERAPFGLCQCTREGVIIRANHWLVRLLGYRRADDLRDVDLATVGFECADDLRWLIERSLNTGKTEAVEANWKAGNGRHIVVRLQALAVADNVVEIVVEDVTNVRALEERLRQAQRMEAVGRVAAEVAVTCDALLRDATRDGDQWLSAIGGNHMLRRQAEQLLAEIRRAAGFLRQFEVYGHQQMSGLQPVSVRDILRDLAPVLKRVVGEEIELVLPKTSGSFAVDVEAERVERVLVNVASYARERMPHGGHVKVDLTTTVVGRRFIARYPSVRPGAQVLITVTELPKAVRHDMVVVGQASQQTAAAVPADKPGVDVTALVDLVANCGGHLWMEAEPAGNMVVKIHLPKRAADETSEKGELGNRSERARRIARWFRTRSAALAGS